MKSIGIDIGTYCIKVVEINSNTRGFQLVQMYTHNLTIRPNVDTHFEVIEFLRTISAKFDPEQTQFIVSIRQDKIAARHRTFPFTDRNKISKTLPLELEDEIPFSIENAVFDFKLQSINPPTSEILAFAVKKEEVAKCIQVLKEGGIKIDIISSEGAAFANLIEKWGEAVTSRTVTTSSVVLEEITQIVSKKVNIILEIGNQHTLVCVFDAGQLISLRTILWGGSQVAEKIAKKYNLPLSEAHKELESKGFFLTKRQEVSPESRTFAELIASTTKELVRDLQISILEIKSEFNAEISKLEITGGMSLIPGFTAFLTQNLEIPCNRINILDQFSHVYIEKSELNDARLGIAIGLAIEGLKKPRNPAINFLKNEFAQKDHRFGEFWSHWSAAIHIAFAGVVALYVWSMLRIDFSSELDLAASSAVKATARQTLGLTGSKSNPGSIEKSLKENKVISADFKNAEKFYQMNSGMDIFKKVSDALPNKNYSKIDLVRFHLVDDQLFLEGYADTARETDLIFESLKLVSANESVRRNQPSLPKFGTKTSFSFSLSVDRGINK